LIGPELLASVQPTSDAEAEPLQIFAENTEPGFVENLLPTLCKLLPFSLGNSLKSANSHIVFGDQNAYIVRNSRSVCPFATELIYVSHEVFVRYSQNYNPRVPFEK